MLRQEELSASRSRGAGAEHGLCQQQLGSRVRLSWQGPVELESASHAAPQGKYQGLPRMVTAWIAPAVFLTALDRSSNL